MLSAERHYLLQGSIKKSMTDDIIKKVLYTVSSYSMICKNDAVLLSLSGGPDSTFLAYFLNSIRDEYDLRLYAFHLDHQTRDGESKKDAEFVHKMCVCLNIELFSEEADVKGWSAKRNYSFQEGARKIRKKSLLKLACARGIQRIALGHNADDNVETFLINLLRGSGTRGLSCMKPVDGIFIRPLIYTKRKNIERYLHEKDIPYCIDKTNLESVYLRNKIRNELIPYIIKNYSESFQSNVLKSLEVLRDEDDFLKEESIKILAALDESTKKDEVKVSLEHFDPFDIAIKRRLILACIEKVKKNLTDISFQNIKDILKYSYPGGEHKKIFLKEDLVFLKQNNYFYFLKEKKGLSFLNRFETFSDYFFLKIDPLANKKEITEFFIEEIKLKITMKLIDPGQYPSDFKSVKINEAYLDYDQLNFPLAVRNWQKGDRFVPLGMKKSKKVQDFFTDIKIEKNKRCLIPIFSDNDNIIWITGFRIDERAKVSEKTKKILYIKTNYKR